MTEPHILAILNDHEKRIKELENKNFKNKEECCPHDQSVDNIRAITSSDKNNEEQRPIRSLDILRAKYNLNISVEDIKITDYNLKFFLQNFNSLKNTAIAELVALEISEKNVEIKLRNLINTLTELLRQSAFYETTKLMAESLNIP